MLNKLCCYCCFFNQKNKPIIQVLFLQIYNLIHSLKLTDAKWYISYDGHYM